MFDRFLNNRKSVPYLMLAPFLVLFLLFKVWPILYSIVLSVHDMSGLNRGAFIGLATYGKLLQDPDFYKALINNTKYMIGTMITLIPIPLIIAVLLHSQLVKGRAVFRAIVFIPSLTSLVIAGAIFQILMHEGQGGVLNSVLQAVGLPPQKWLVSASLAMISVLIVATWRWTGINMVYFSSGLAGIQEEVYESASIDGANGFQKFIYITLPLLKPVLIFVATLNVIGGYKLFTEVYTLWRGGISPDKGGLTLAIYLYRNAFSYFRLGYASTIGLVMAIIILVLSVLQLKLTGFFNED